MRGVIIKKTSHNYFLSYYDKQKEKTVHLNTGIEVTLADRKRYDEKAKGEKSKIVGTPELRQLVSEFRMARYRQEIENQVGLKLERQLRFQEAYNNYNIEKPHLKPSTVHLYDYAVKKWIEYEGNKYVADYTKKHFKHFSDKLIEDGIKQVTRHIITNRLSVLFNFFVKQKLVQENIITVVPAPPYKADPIFITELMIILNYFDKKLSELQKTNYQYDATDIIYQRLFIYFQLYTGFRPSTTVRLTWDDINLDIGTIYAENVKGGKKFHFPIHDSLRELLGQFPKQSGDLFPYKYPKVSFWDRAMKKLLKEGLIQKKYQLYQLRDTFSTMFADAGVDIETVSALLNHSDTRITKASYVQANINRLRNAINEKDIFKNLK